MKQMYSGKVKWFVWVNSKELLHIHVCIFYFICMCDFKLEKANVYKGPNENKLLEKGKFCVLHGFLQFCFKLIRYCKWERGVSNKK